MESIQNGIVNDKAQRNCTEEENANSKDEINNGTHTKSYKTMAANKAKHHYNASKSAESNHAPVHGNQYRPFSYRSSSNRNYSRKSENTKSYKTMAANKAKHHYNASKSAESNHAPVHGNQYRPFSYRSSSNRNYSRKSENKPSNKKSNDKERVEPSNSGFVRNTVKQLDSLNSAENSKTLTKPLTRAQLRINKNNTFQTNSTEAHKFDSSERNPRYKEKSRNDVHQTKGTVRQVKEKAGDKVAAGEDKKANFRTEHKDLSKCNAEVHKKCSPRNKDHDNDMDSNSTRIIQEGSSADSSTSVAGKTDDISKSDNLQQSKICTDVKESEETSNMDQADRKRFLEQEVKDLTSSNAILKDQLNHLMLANTNMKQMIQKSEDVYMRHIENQAHLLFIQLEKNKTLLWESIDKSLQKLNHIENSMKLLGSKNNDLLHQVNECQNEIKKCKRDATLKEKDLIRRIAEEKVQNLKLEKRNEELELLLQQSQNTVKELQAKNKELEFSLHQEHQNATKFKQNLVNLKTDVKANLLNSEENIQEYLDKLSNTMIDYTITLSRKQVSEKVEKAFIEKTLETIRNIHEDVEQYEKQINQFKGNNESKTYLHIKEMLFRAVEKLDEIESEGKEEIVNARRRSIKYIKELKDDLEERVQ